MITPFTKVTIYRTAFIFSLFFFSTGEPVTAQIAFTNNAYLKAETRRSRRDAAQIETDLKETHLVKADFTHKKGKSSRKRLKAKDRRKNYYYDSNGKIVYSEPVRFTFKRQMKR